MHPTLNIRFIFFVVFFLLTAVQETNHRHLTLGYYMDCGVDFTNLMSSFTFAS